MNKYFCCKGHEYDEKDVKHWAHDKIYGDLPSHGISICPFCCDMKELSKHYIVSKYKILSFK